MSNFLREIRTSYNPLYNNIAATIYNLQLPLLLYKYSCNRGSNVLIVKINHNQCQIVITLFYKTTSK